MNLWLEKHEGVEPEFAELETCNLGILFMKNKHTITNSKLGPRMYQGPEQESPEA